MIGTLLPALFFLAVLWILLLAEASPLALAIVALPLLAYIVAMLYAVSSRQ